MKIILTKKESEKYFFNSLCNLSVIRGYGLELAYDEKEYVYAAEKLRTKSKESPSHEEVLMEILNS